MPNMSPTLTLSMITAIDEEETNYAPRLLFADARVEDAEDNFDGGELAITGLVAGEIISVRNEGSLVGQIGFDGTNVSYGGVVIGTASGGNGTDFTVSFNAAATYWAISALLRNITYQNISDTPAAAMNLSVSLRDGSGAAAHLAQGFTEMTGGANPLDGESTSGYSAPVFVDLDGDGDLDMVSGENNGALKFYRNDGTAIAPSFVEITGSANPFDGFFFGVRNKPAFVDVDGDGDLDLVTGNSSTGLFYFRNDGTATEPLFVAISSSVSPFYYINVSTPTAAPAFADIDGDGDADLVMGSGDGSLKYYRNDGNATTPVFVAVYGNANPFDGVNVGLYSTPSFTDMDGDGDLDLFIGNASGLIYHYRNDGSATAPSFVSIPASESPVGDIDVGSFSAPTFADLDGDGDADLLVGDHNGNFTYYRNDTFAGMVLTPRTGAANPLDGKDVGFGSAPTFIDLDGDGDLDMVSGESGGTLKYYRNEGSSSAPSFVELTGSASPFNGIDVGTNSKPTFADLDGDGDDDLIIGAGDGSLNYYRNDGTSYTLVTGSADPFGSINFWGSSKPVLADIDGDGDLDLLVGTNGSLSYWRNDGSPSAPSFTVVTGGANPFYGIEWYGSNLAPVLKDADGDGDLDLLVGGNSGVRYWRNDGTATAPQFTAMDGDTNPFGNIQIYAAQPALADIDGDGDPDLVVGQSNGTFVFHENNPLTRSDFTAIAGSANPVSGIGGRPTFADVDGDGDLDLLAGGSSQLYYWRNDGTATAPSFSLITGTDDPFDGLIVGLDNSPVLADVDGDGDFDLLVGRHDGTLDYWRNDGTATAPSYTSANYEGAFGLVDVGSRSVPVLADVDGDGDLDLLVGSGSGDLQYWRNDGSATWANHVQLTGAANPFDGISTAARSRPELVDIDGDGDLDLVLGQASGGFSFWRNEGTATTPNYVQLTGPANPLNGISTASHSGATFTDLDGDGDLDLIVSTGSSLEYYENTGTTFLAFASITPHVDPSDNDDVMHGTSGDDIIDGLGGFDVIRGLGGNDTLFGSDGDDELEGGDGDDALSGGFGFDILKGGPGLDWMYGGSEDDTLYGDAGEDVLFGEDGDDELVGGDGNDSLDGGIGHDFMNGGDGDDWLYGGDGDDAIGGAYGNDVLFGGNGDDFMDGGFGQDSLDGGIGADTLNGGDDDDWLYGGDDADILNGDAGNDALFGQNGNDVLRGDDGDDSLNGGTGIDTLYGDAGNDWLYGLDNDDTLYGGDGDDALFGGIGNDVLRGGAGNDSLDGGDGNDILNGGEGNADVLSGGAGADIFYFTALDEGGDVILDFSTGEDVIWIDAVAFGLAISGSLPASMFESGAGLPASFSATGPVFYHETTSNGLWFDPTGGSSSDVAIVTGLQTGVFAYTDIELV